MAKMYSKSDLKFEDGYVLTYEDEIVALPDGVAEQFNELETFMQQQKYLADQPEAQPEPSLDGFKRETIFEVPKVKIQTPAIDKLVEEKKQILHELRDETVAAEVNKILAKYQDAFRFMKQDKFVEGTKAVAIDTPTLGNVLTLDANAVIETISALSGISI